MDREQKEKRKRCFSACILCSACVAGVFHSFARLVPLREPRAVLLSLHPGGGINSAAEGRYDGTETLSVRAPSQTKKGMSLTHSSPCSKNNL